MRDFSFFPFSVTLSHCAVFQYSSKIWDYRKPSMLSRNNLPQSFIIFKENVKIKVKWSEIIVGYYKLLLLNTYTVLLPIQTCETCRILWIFQVLSERLVSGCSGWIHFMSFSCCFFTCFMLSSVHAYNDVFRFSTPVSSFLHLGS